MKSAYGIIGMPDLKARNRGIGRAIAKIPDFLLSAVRRIDKLNLQRNTTRTIITAINKRTRIGRNPRKIECNFYGRQITTRSPGSISGRPHTGRRRERRYTVIRTIGTDGLINDSVLIISAGTSVHMFAYTLGSIILTEIGCI